MRRLTKNFEEILSSIFISITIVLVILNVFLRYIFNTGIPWSEEVATMSFVWSVFMGASACYKHRMHIGIDLLTKLMPDKIQKYIMIIVDLIMLVINGYLLYLSYIFTMLSIDKPTSVLGISSAYVNTSLVVGFGLMAIHSIKYLIGHIKELKVVPEEVNNQSII